MSSAKLTTLEELGEMLAHVVDHMATKSDVGNLGEEIAGIRTAMATKDDLRQELNPVRAELKSMLLRQHPQELSTPPPIAIAHHIIRDFVEHGSEVLIR